MNHSQFVAMMVVVPLFLFCYGCSCVAYTVYKIYRHFSYESLHAKFVHLHAADYAAQMMPPTYPTFFATNKMPYKPRTYLNEPVHAGAAVAAVSFLCSYPRHHMSL